MEDKGFTEGNREKLMMTVGRSVVTKKQNRQGRYTEEGYHDF
jgi:hypothetical protein